jgi:hypothetical protein
MKLNNNFYLTINLITAPVLLTARTKKQYKVDAIFVGFLVVEC